MLRSNPQGILAVTGGLGDVMGALPKALSRRGHRVMVVAPRYGDYAEGWETGVRRQIRVFNSDQEVHTTCTVALLIVQSSCRWPAALYNYLVMNKQAACSILV